MFVRWDRLGYKHGCTWRARQGRHASIIPKTEQHVSILDYELATLIGPAVVFKFPENSSRVLIKTENHIKHPIIAITCFTTANTDHPSMRRLQVN